MFPARFYPPVYFAPRYFPERGTGVGGGDTSPIEAPGSPDYQQSRYFVRSPWEPHEVIAELTTAQGPYAWQEMEPGTAQVTVHNEDPAVSEDVLQAGNFFSIEHPLMPAFAGVLMTAEDGKRGGTLTLNILEHYGLLDARSAPQDLAFEDAVGAGIVAKSVVNIANSRLHTGIDVIAAPGPPVEDLPVGGQSVLEVLNELHDRTGYEHWTESECMPSHLNTTLYFDQRRGEDVSDSLHLFEGPHFADTRHKQDASQARQTVTVLGDFGVEIAERQSVTRSSLLNAKDIAAKAYESTSFLPSDADSLPGLYAERLQIEVTTSSRAELSRRADKAQTKPLRKQQTFEDDVALPALSEAQTRLLRIGNTWTRHGRFGGRYLARVVRITGMEFDPPRALLHLDSEIVL